MLYVQGNANLFFRSADHLVPPKKKSHLLIFHKVTNGGKRGGNQKKGCLSFY